MAPTCLLWWHEAHWLVGVQGGLLHRGHPLWKCRGREAAVLAGVCVRLEQGDLVRLENNVLVGSVPCRETTCGKVLRSLTQAGTNPAPREQSWSHLRAPRMGPASQGRGERCHIAAAAPPESRALWDRCCLWRSTMGRMSHLATKPAPAEPSGCPPPKKDCGTSAYLGQ